MANTLEWSVDGRQLLFVLAQGGVAGSLDGPPYENAIWRVPAFGGTAEPVGIVMQEWIKSPFLHSDGKRLFFTAVDTEKSEVWTLENFLPKR